MIILVFLQLFQVQIDSARSYYDQARYTEAYNQAFSIDIESLREFKYCEVLEMRGYYSLRTYRLDQSTDIYNRLFNRCDHKNILYNAYLNYADLNYYKQNFKRRKVYLEYACRLDATPKVIRIIARHYFQVEADFETAQIWIDKHPVVIDPKEQAGFNLLMAEFNESKRKYELAIRYYNMAKINAQEANLFNYELFAAIGKYRTINLSNEKKERNMINTISWLILGILSFAWWYSRKNNKNEL
jgi:hypothetical protein